jgi:xanthine dehydrogenase YagS FAD-binding subunit
MVLNAQAGIAGANGSKSVPVESLFKLPEVNRRSQNVLEAGELIETIDIPLPSEGSKGIYLKIMERATWSFAMVSVAVQIEWDGEQARQARIALGGVAGMPWRVPAAEKLLIGQKMNEDLAIQVSEAAVSEARPLEYNQYKIPMVKNLLKRAILKLKPPAK